MRLLCGLLVARSGAYVLTGRLALCQRPMQRVIKPLQKMGAHIWQDAVFGDIHIRPTQRLRAIHHQVLLPSAQVKSAILLAALGADGETTLHQPVRTRDHTERLLASIGVVVSRSDAMLGVHPKPTWASLHLTVPGDCSAAAFWWVAACLQSAAELTTPAVGLNPTRTGLLRCLRRMGAHIVVRHQRQCHGELISDVTVHASQLQAIEVTAEEVVSMIDELPVLAVACAAAQGVSTIRGAHELRYKESNRLRTMHAALGRLGVAIELLDDGWRIQGGVMIGGEVQAAGDHRVAMALAVASTVAKGPVTIHGAACCAKSDRYFFEQLTRLSGSPPVVVKD
jgi:3-phosphoshikimate 1-carboxyvinyltransferase